MEYLKQKVLFISELTYNTTVSCKIYVCFFKNSFWLFYPFAHKSRCTDMKNRLRDIYKISLEGSCTDKYNIFTIIQETILGMYVYWPFLDLKPMIYN